MIKKYFLLFLIVGLFIGNSPVLAQVDPEFDPNNIISDDAILNSSAMSLADIKNFLGQRKSFLSQYSAPDSDGVVMSAAEIIYNASMNNYDCYGVKLSDNPNMAERRSKCTPITINPRFLLVLLQKEQGLIDSTNPSQSALDWATGYGCPDSGGCNERWKGFGKQVNSAALQFYDYMVNPRLYKYKAGQTYLFTNPFAIEELRSDVEVTPTNSATAALYNYTPHVYNGNYNFYKLWQRYFSQDLLNGSLVQINGEAGVWLIQNGQKRPFLSKSALLSRYDTSRVIKVSATDLGKYSKGAPIRFSQYSIVQAPDGKIYLLVDDKKRLIVSDEVFRKIGFNPMEIEQANWEDVLAYVEGAPISAEVGTPIGYLAQDATTGGVYWVEDTMRYPLWDAVLLKTKFKDRPITKMTTEELAVFTQGNPVKFEDGYLLKSSISSAVYIIEDGKKRPIVSGDVFVEHGFKWENIVSVSPKLLYLYDNGEALVN